MIECDKKNLYSMKNTNAGRKTSPKSNFSIGLIRSQRTLSMLIKRELSIRYNTNLTSQNPRWNKFHLSENSLDCALIGLTAGKLARDRWNPQDLKGLKHYPELWSAGRVPLRRGRSSIVPSASNIKTGWGRLHHYSAKGLTCNCYGLSDFGHSEWSTR